MSGYRCTHWWIRHAWKARVSMLMKGTVTVRSPLCGRTDRSTQALAIYEECDRCRGYRVMAKHENDYFQLNGEQEVVALCNMRDTTSDPAIKASLEAALKYLGYTEAL